MTQASCRRAACALALLAAACSTSPSATTGGSAAGSAGSVSSSAGTGTGTSGGTSTSGAAALHFRSTPTAAAVVGEPWSYRAIVSGAGSTAYTLTTGPTGASIDSNGLLSWTPAAGQSGAQSFTLSAALNGETATQSFTVTAASPKQLAQKSISPANPNGGQVTVNAPLSPIRGAAVTLPPRSLAGSAPVAVTISALSDAPVPPLALSGGLTASDLLPVDFGPSGTTFQAPVQIDLPLSPALLAQVNAGQKAQVQTFNYQTGEWDVLPLLSVDATAGLAVAQVNHFSTYVVAPATNALNLQVGLGNGASCNQLVAVSAPLTLPFDQIPASAINNYFGVPADTAETVLKNLPPGQALQVFTSFQGVNTAGSGSPANAWTLASATAASGGGNYQATVTTESHSTQFLAIAPSTPITNAETWLAGGQVVSYLAALGPSAASVSVTASVSLAVVPSPDANLPPPQATNPLATVNATAQMLTPISLTDANCNEAIDSFDPHATAAAPPLLVPSPPGTQQVLLGHSLTLSVTEANGQLPMLSWSSSDPAGLSVTPSGNGTSATVTGEQLGSFTINAAAPMGGGVSWPVVVNAVAATAPRVSLTASSTAVLPGRTVTLQANASDPSTPPGQLSYGWAISPAAALNASGPLATFVAPTQAGDYTVTCVASDGVSPSLPATAVISVLPATTALPLPPPQVTPLSAVLYLGVDGGSGPVSVVLTATDVDPNGAALTYGYAQGPGNAPGATLVQSATGATFTARALGNYQVFVTATDTLGSSSPYAVAQIQVLDPIMAGAVDADGDGYPAGIDCDDNDATIYPGAPEACGDPVDRNCDGVLTSLANGNCDEDGDGYLSGIDCNDLNPAVNPGAKELCDGIDNNCNGQIDEGFDVGARCTVTLGTCQSTGTLVCDAVGLGTYCNAPVIAVSCAGVACGQPSSCGTTCLPGSGCTAADGGLAGCVPACTGLPCNGPDGCGGLCATGAGCVAPPAIDAGTAGCRSNADCAAGFLCDVAVTGQCIPGAGTCQSNVACPAGTFCQGGVCVPASGTCSPLCQGLLCGSPDGCGAACLTGSGCVALGGVIGDGGCSPQCVGDPCGAADGCGGSCAIGSGCAGCTPQTCPTGTACDGANGQCVAVCAPTCRGVLCGGPDGCGGVCAAAEGCVSCTTITCPAGTACGAGGSCVPNGCTPSCQGACGAANGCGGICQVGSGCSGCSAASCPAGTVCNATGGCVDYCAPQCQGVACGGPNGCGGVCAAGSGCVSPQTDGGLCAPDCLKVACGASDGCGSTCPLGSGCAPCTPASCPTGSTCVATGLCVSSCVPKCQDVACGSPDGCGGVCAAGDGCVGADGGCAPSCSGAACGGPDGCGGICEVGSGCSGCTPASCPAGTVCTAAGICAAATDAGCTVCIAGFCGASCPSGQQTCGTTNGVPSCTDVTSDSNNCGACGNTCATGQSCAQGKCVANCANNAGGGACPPLQLSDGGFACGTECPTGYSTLCKQSCVDTATDPNNCGSCGTTCPTGEVCTNGACGTACPNGQVCTGQGCAASCPAGTAVCGTNTVCTSTQTDPSNCGACGVACGASQVCLQGSCVASCAPTPGGNGCPPQTLPDGGLSCAVCQTKGYAQLCDGMLCVDTGNDPSNCGGCSVVCPQGSCTNGSCQPACATGQVCSGGGCAAACPAGSLACDGGSISTCVDPTSDANNCGGCGTVCPAGEACVGGTCAAACGTTGACSCTGILCGLSSACGEVCKPGQGCTDCSSDAQCPAGEVCTGGLCAGNGCAPKCAGVTCGAADGCGGTCAAGSGCTQSASCQACVEGLCATSCPAGTSVCGNVNGVPNCSDTQTDSSNCGACGVACSGTQVCAQGTCVAACAPKSTAGPQCPASPGSDGGFVCGPPCATTSTSFCAMTEICTNLATDSNNCGSCGTVCTGGLVCQNGACGPACGSGQVCTTQGCAAQCPSGSAVCTAGSPCTNLASDSSNCGSCGTACPSGELCVQGACVVSCQTASGAPICSPTPGPDGGETCAPCLPLGAPDACGTLCTDLQTDPKNCGTCGTACPNGVCTAGVCQSPCANGQVCASGGCVAACPAGATACVSTSGGTPTCVDTSTDSNNCGACGKICPGNTACAAGVCTELCSSACSCSGVVCGLTNGCGQTCVAGQGCATCGATSCPAGYSCEGAQCVSNSGSCTGGLTLCGTSCTNVSTDPANCGACGKTCPTGDGCSGGQCTTGGDNGDGGSCPAGENDCPTGCTNLQSDINNCGACGTVCAGATPSCSAGSCVSGLGQGSPCTATTQCEASLICYSSKGICEPPSPAGGPCGDSSDCLSGLACEGGTCVMGD